MKHILFVLFSCGIINLIYSQSITGTVFDNEKKPLVGANVYWAGTQQGTTTDQSGQFSIAKHESSKRLVFSFVGFTADTIIVQANSKPLKIKLKPLAELSEVTVAERAESIKLDHMNPIQTQILTGCELQKAACCNLSESFETNASVDVSYSDAVTGAKQIQLLGLSGTYVQLMTENFPNYTGLSRTYGMNYIPGPWMAGISISKGTASVINGYDALTGQINIEYLKPAQSDKFYVNLFANSGYKFESNIHGSVKFNDKWSTMLLFHSGNNSTELDHNSDGFLDMPLSQQYIVFNRWDYFNKKGFSWRFGAKYLYEDRLGGQTGFDRSAPLSENGRFGIGIDTRRVEAFSKFGYVMPNKPSQSIALITNFSNHSQNSFYGLNEYDAMQNSIYANLIFQTDIKNPKHTLSSGIDFRNDDYDESLNQAILDKTETGAGLYSQYTFKPNKKLTTLAGIRADYNSIHKAFITPRAHVKYSFTDNLSARISAGKGYRTANIIAENSYLLASSRTIEIADDIAMEEAWNFGANIAKSFMVNNQKWKLSADYYRTSFINQVVVDIDSDISAIQFYNLAGESYANNYQIELNAVPFKGMEATVAYRFSDVKTSYGETMLDKPLANKYKGLFTASYQTPLKKWQFDFTAQLNGGGRIPELSENPEAGYFSTSFDPYTILNAQITKYFRKWNVYFGAENLLGFVQENPIIDPENPFGANFDASMIWGPVDGRKFYAGIRYIIERY